MASLSSMPIPMPRVDRFRQAMESLYGRFALIDRPETWTPPPASGGHRGRYLWTDAYGVLNFITLHCETAPGSSSNRRRSITSSSSLYLTLARRLVETVHDVLGRTRDGKAWLPGASDENPVGGGLRIGKLEASGPDADGQYHHYLTIWMFALNRLSVATGDPVFNRQAVALAKAIHPRFFVNRASDRPRMVWKMAMDLSAPLVASEGNLDPIDGYVVFRLLQQQAKQQAQAQANSEDADADGEVLAEEIADYKRVMARKGPHFVSSDPLDLGMTLWTVHWFSETEDWAAQLADRCYDQIYDLFGARHYLDRNVRYRLAFREFGTAIGLQCHLQQTRQKAAPADLKAIADAIIAAWEPQMDLTRPADSTDPADLTPDDLRPITRVMYASALIPGAFRSGYLGPEQ